MGAAEDWVRGEQEALWTDLESAIRQAYNGAWSMQAADVARRIAGAARIVGPTPWQDVPWALLAGGVYEAVLDAGEIQPVLPSSAEWADVEPRMAEHGGTRAEAGLRFARTVAAIGSGRERRWIRGDEEES